MSEDFANFLISQSTAITCLALGYTETSPACLNALTDVVKQYIRWIGEQSVEVAESSGRCHPGILDVLSIIGDYKELNHFKLQWNQPSQNVIDVPDFPVKKQFKRFRNELMSDSAVHGNNVPDHLPNFPPKHTYSRKTRRMKAPDDGDNQAKLIAETKSMQATLTKLESK